MPRLFIGLPVYNGEKFLAAALDSLIQQRYQDWEILISDNASDDATSSISQAYCTKDSRIRYHRHSKNLGAINNFLFVAEAAQSSYFAWAAADDLWHPDFFLNCVALLEGRADCNMAFSNMVNVDSCGRSIRNYLSFERFISLERQKNVVRYLREPEILGKANLIYSVYRREFLVKVIREHPLRGGWGADMAFVLAVLARTNLSIDFETHFMKRLERPGDTASEAQEIHIDDPKRHIFPLKEAPQYIANLLSSLRGTPFLGMGLRIMLKRLGFALILKTGFPLGFLKMTLDKKD